MSELDDHQLLAEFARRRSETAFTELVKRHAGLVFSTALRSCGNPHHAEEITQAVFIILARKAGTLSSRAVVSGWLYQTARLTAANFVKGEIRRRRHEQEACMQSTLNEPDAAAWETISPLLDEAMGVLGETDRNAIILRYFENRTSREIGVALRMNEETARKRVNRALEKLRHFFVKRGVTVSNAALSGALSANSIQPVPAVMVKSICAVAVAKGAAASGSTLTLIKGALKIMAWTKAKTAVVIGVVAILTAGTATVIVKKVVHPDAWADDPRYWRLDNPPLATYPPVLILRPTHFSGRGGGIGDGSRYLERDAAIQDLIAIAYGFQDTRIVFPEGLSQSRPRPGYDLMLTLPNHPREALQEAIQKQFGLAGHTETIATNVLRLRVANPNAPGLQPSSKVRSQSSGSFSGNRSIVFRDQPLNSLLYSIEEEVRQPVLDETGLNGRYDVNLQWQPQAGETDKSAFERGLREQLGLELVPTNMPIEMLVVEKAN